MFKSELIQCNYENRELNIFTQSHGVYCVYYPCTVQHGKWSPFASDPQTGINDPQIGPQIANDPEPQMILDVDRKWSRRQLEFGFLDFFIFIFNFLYLSINFYQLNDELDEQKKRYYDNVNYNLNIILLINSSYFRLTILQKNYKKKSKTATPFLNKLDLQQQ